ncbi:hypothetical protein BDP55DRAFT_740630 [Colletotrichum godetiae]|uniref:Uncharacterized protein n=1 Tax=Colletotrichum godetiae TaxID=1209918 RepID=A0AAJ0ASN1_9PEZI|nr:uncharacterized protein BDP55DRAFT_740630 [Colletotrichum godetiae]KAK1687379.1 hypothetical protein BDP55DRAFT_740630 [Colletotrichum godetiae]
MAVTSTLYMPLVETHFYFAGGQQLFTVYTLQPQTTPFTPKDASCSILPRAIRALNAGIPHRECTSLLSTPTEVWINNIVTTRESESTIATSWTKVFLSNLPSGSPIIVNHPVFPLYGKIPSRQVEGADRTELSAGAIAGIVVGVLVLFLALFGCSWFMCFKKRKQKRGAQLWQGETALGREAPSHGGESYGSKMELPDHGREAQEMHTMRPSPVELSSQSRAAEIEAGSRPVELAS